MDSSLSSEQLESSAAASSAIGFVFRDLAGNLISAPTEWAPAWVEITGVPTSVWQQVRLFCQGQPLEVLSRCLKTSCGDAVPRLLAEWPRAGTGHYQLELLFAEQSFSRVLTIHSQKISPTAYARLLEDLEASLPTSIAIALQRLGGFAGVHFLPPAQTTLAQELIRLERAVKGHSQRLGLASVLRALATDPHQILCVHETWTSAEKARRPVAARLQRALARPGNMVLEKSEGTISSIWRPQKVLDARVEHSVDVFENRLLKVYYDQVQRRLRRLIHRLQAMSGQDDLLEKARQLANELSQARQAASFLDKVALPSHLPDNLTMVLLKRLPYRAAVEGYVEFRRSMAASIETPALDAPLENLPYLYQIWNTLQVTLALLEQAEVAGFRVKEHSLFRREGDGLYLNLLPNGYPILTLLHPQHQVRVRLIPERTYGAKGSLRSISFLQRPDIAVEVHWPDGQPQLLLFDPKYKLDSEELRHRIATDAPADYAEQLDELLQDAPDQYQRTTGMGKPKKVDIDKMHTYRDAIEDQHRNRVVSYAAILYPGDDVTYSPELEALRAYPSRDEDLRRRLKQIFSAVLA